MAFNLNELEVFACLQFEVIFCRNNILAVFCIFANSVWIICTLVSAGGRKGLQMVYTQCEISLIYVKEFGFSVLMFLDSKKFCAAADLANCFPNPDK